MIDLKTGSEVVLGLTDDIKSQTLVDTSLAARKLQYVKDGQIIVYNDSKSAAKARKVKVSTIEELAANNEGNWSFLEPN